MEREPPPDDGSVTSTALVVDERASVLERIPELGDVAENYRRRAVAKNTEHARAADLRAFDRWCCSHGESAAVPARPDTVAAFLSAMASGIGCGDGRPKAVSTVMRYAWTIHGEHKRAGIPSPLSHPAVAAVVAGIRNVHGVAPRHKKAALTIDLLARCLPQGDSVADVRDRAVLCVGVSTGMRRSEIVALEVGDVAPCEDGYVLTIRRSKTDQSGRGRTVALARSNDPRVCGVRALEAWLARSGVRDGPLLRGLWRGGRVRPRPLCGREVALIVKRAAASAGLDVDAFSGHSLRSGYVTAAHERGLPWEAIMKQTGHKTLAVAEGYSRHTPALFAATRAAEVVRVRDGPVTSKSPDENPTDPLGR